MQNLHFSEVSIFKINTWNDPRRYLGLHSLWKQIKQFLPKYFHFEPQIIAVFIKRVQIALCEARAQQLSSHVSFFAQQSGFEPLFSWNKGVNYTYTKHVIKQQFFWRNKMRSTPLWLISGSNDVHQLQQVKLARNDYIVDQNIFGQFYWNIQQISNNASPKLVNSKSKYVLSVFGHQLNENDE